MAGNELLNTECAQGRLVITAATISVKPTQGPRLPQHWSIRVSSLATVDMSGSGPYRELTFTTKDGRRLAASNVPTNDAERAIQIFAPIGTLSRTRPPAPQSTPPVYPIPGNAPTLPAQWIHPTYAQPQQSPSLWQRFSILSLNARIAVLGLSLIVVCACCGIGIAATSAGNNTAGTSVQATDTPGHTILTSSSPAATATPTPKPTATPKPKPTATPKPKPTCIPGAVNCNPWGYNFNPGNLIYSVPSGFCGYFSCISTFFNGRGYVVQCQDGMFSKSGGIQGSCSHHGGDRRPLYSH